MLSREISIGDLRGFIYDLQRGEGLPLHVHGRDDVHITIVATGRIIVRGPTITQYDVLAGGCVDFDAGAAHEIVAKADGTRIYNICKYYGGRNAQPESR